MDHNEQGELAVRETPSQANFIGRLAIVLLAFAVVVAVAGFLALARG